MCIRTNIKDRLIKKIQEVEDLEILEEIYSWLEDESQQDIYVTSDIQKQAIKKGLKQLKDGQTLTEEQANQEIDQWLNDAE